MNQLNEINVGYDDCKVTMEPQPLVHHEILTCSCGNRHDLTDLRQYEDGFECECGLVYNIKQNF